MIYDNNIGMISLAKMYDKSSRKYDKFFVENMYNITSNIIRSVCK